MAAFGQVSLPLLRVFSIFLLWYKCGSALLERPCALGVERPVRQSHHLRSASRQVQASLRRLASGACRLRRASQEESKQIAHHRSTWSNGQILLAVSPGKKYFLPTPRIGHRAKNAQQTVVIFITQQFSERPDALRRSSSGAADSSLGSTARSGSPVTLSAPRTAADLKNSRRLCRAGI